MRRNSTREKPTFEHGTMMCKSHPLALGRHAVLPATACSSEIDNYSSRINTFLSRAVRVATSAEGRCCLALTIARSVRNTTGSNSSNAKHIKVAENPNTSEPSVRLFDAVVSLKKEGLHSHFSGIHRIKPCHIY